MAWINNEIITSVTVGKISLLDRLCSGSGSTYHPDLEREINLGITSETPLSIFEIFSSPSYLPLHSTNQLSSFPILKSGICISPLSTMASTIGKDPASIWPCSKGGYLTL